ncbi:MAG: hypothetical protein E6J71_10745 [Deltaproteobacteria bacterium]|nr:MAG: hypothetical protein E6J71_10745 [Deltaproteobacteria bacterium]
MRGRARFIVVAGLGILACGSSRLAAAADAVVPREELSQKVVVRDVVVGDDGAVSGVLANTSGHRLREVRLLIRYQWLWRDEFHPGSDSPGTATYYVVPEEIPPGGTASFSYRPEPPLPRRSDGTFQTAVEVAGLLEFSD